MINDQSFGIIPFYLKDQTFKYLLIEHQKGHWAFPKGHAESTDNSEIETAKREFYEETGLNAHIFMSQKQFREEYWFTNPDGQKVSKKVDFYLGVVDPDTKFKLQTAEVANAKWLSFSEAIDLMTFPAGKKVIQLAHDYLLQHQDEIKNL